MPDDIEARIQQTRERYRLGDDGGFRVADLPTRPPDGRATDKKLKRELRKHVKQLHDLQRRLFADGRHAVLVVFQAMDAAGKDSTIRKVFSGVNPAGFRYTAFGAPAGRETRQDFLWRCQRALPGRGKIGIFNRSHYEEVLIVRVQPEILAAQRLPDVDPKSVWQERMESIRDWEQHLSRNGVAIVKFWLNVSRDEQKRRFLSRIDRTHKNWKFAAADLDVRRRWDDYMHAYEQALRETSRPHAPWYAIPADHKPYMRTAVARILVATLQDLNLAYPTLDDKQRELLRDSRQRLMDEDAS